MPSKIKKFRVSGLVGCTLLFDQTSGYTLPGVKVKIAMEVVSPNGHCFIHEDKTGKYELHSEAVKAFVEFGRSSEK